MNQEGTALNEVSLVRLHCHWSLSSPNTITLPLL
jgi:hypothetical protein